MANELLKKQSGGINSVAQNYAECVIGKSAQCPE
ncbi:protein of unknown function [Paraburkholderia kururiensis]